MPLASRLRERHPGVELRLLTAYSGHLQQWLDDGVVDMSLLYNLRTTPSLFVTPILREQLWVVAPSDAELRAAQPVPPKELCRHPLVMPAAAHGLRVLVDQVFVRMKAVPTITIETNAMVLQKQFVQSGYGWTILPAAGVVADVEDGRLSAAPLDDPDATRDVVLGLPLAGRLAPAVEAAARELISVSRGLVDSGVWPSAQLLD